METTSLSSASERRRLSSRHSAESRQLNEHRQTNCAGSKDQPRSCWLIHTYVCVCVCVCVSLTAVENQREWQKG